MANQYRVTNFQATRWQVIHKNGMKAPATPIFAASDKERAEQLAEALSYAYEAGKVAQRLESSNPMLFAICDA